MSEKTSYLVNVDKHALVGKFASIEAAQKAGEAAKYEFDVIASDEDFSKRYALKDMVTLYNKASKSSLVKFPNKEEGVRRVLQAFEGAELEVVGTAAEAPKKGKRAKREKKDPKPKLEPGYRGHRQGTRKEAAHKFFDETKNLTRKAFIQHLTTELTIAETTAASWYQAFRQDALTS